MGVTFALLGINRKLKSKKYKIHYLICFHNNWISDTSNFNVSQIIESFSLWLKDLSSISCIIKAYIKVKYSLDINHHFMQNHPLNKERLMTLDIVSIFTKNFNWSRNVSGSLYLDQVEKQCLELLTNNDFFHRKHFN